MKVWVFEDNLMWSSRLVQSLKGLGHTPELRTTVPPTTEDAEAAIVNLGSRTLRPEDLVPNIRALGVHVIGHAGHKETELLDLGRTIQCDTLTTNSELTYKLESILEKARS